MDIRTICSFKISDSPQESLILSVTDCYTKFEVNAVFFF